MASAFWEDVATAVSSGLAGSSNPYLSTAGGILGGGGGGGGVVVAKPPPPPPVPASPGGGMVGNIAPALPWIVGGIFGVVVLALALGVRR